MTPGEEARIRADERLRVLREARKLASDMDRNPANDPYLWGYGARLIVAALTKRLAAHRDAMGAEAVRAISQKGRSDG